LVETSKPAGGVTVTAPAKFEPLALKVCAAEGAGAVVEKPVSDEGVALIAGVGATTVPLTATLVAVAPPPVRVTLPEKLPAEAPMRRTETARFRRYWSA